MLNGKLMGSAGELACTYALSGSKHFSATLAEPLLNPDTSSMSFHQLVTEEGIMHQLTGDLGMELVRNAQTNAVELFKISGSVV